MTLSKNGFSGSVTHAWSGWVMMGSVTPAILLTTVAHPAVQFTTAGVAIAPRLVTTPVMAPVGPHPSPSSC